jgi:hypothetical protein
MDDKIAKKAKNIKTFGKLKQFLIGLAISLLLLFITITGVFLWGFFKLEWRGGLIDEIARVVPLPAARVNTKLILYRDYLQALNAARNFYNYQKEHNVKGVPNDEQLQKIILEDRLIKNEFVYDLAKKYNVVIRPDDIQAKLDEIIKNKGSEEETLKFLNEVYGIDFAIYKKYFISPNLYYDKTKEAISQNDQVNVEIRKKLEEALNKLKESAQFEDIARQYSDEEIEADRGKETVVLLGEFPADIEDKLVFMKEGEITDILTNNNKLQIIKLIKRDEEKGTFTLKIISAKITTIDDLIKEAKEKAQIKIYAY